MVNRDGLMGQKEGRRQAVLSQVLDGRMGHAVAASALSVSVRQIKRLCRQVRDQGGLELLSRRHGVPSNRRIDAALKERFIGIVLEPYGDFGLELARVRDHGFEHSTRTLRGWMVLAQL